MSRRTLDIEIAKIVAWLRAHRLAAYVSYRKRQIILRQGRDGPIVRIEKL